MSSRTPGQCMLLMAALLLGAAPAAAQVYKWVDENGKVHFGDKPRDEATASQAEQVEIREDYPAATEGGVATPSPVAPSAASVAARRERDRKRAEEEQAAREQRAEERRKRCAEYEEEYRKFTEIRMINGRPTYHYVKDETGKSLTSAQQREYLEQVKGWSAEAGCPPL